MMKTLMLRIYTLPAHENITFTHELKYDNGVEKLLLYLL